MLGKSQFRKSLQYSLIGILCPMITFNMPIRVEAAYTTVIDGVEYLVEEIIPGLTDDIPEAKKFYDVKAKPIYSQNSDGTYYNTMFEDYSIVTIISVLIDKNIAIVQDTSGNIIILYMDNIQNQTELAMFNKVYVQYGTWLKDTTNPVGFNLPTNILPYSENCIGKFLSFADNAYLFTDGKQFIYLYPTEESSLYLYDGSLTTETFVEIAIGGTNVSEQNIMLGSILTMKELIEPTYFTVYNVGFENNNLILSGLQGGSKEVTITVPPSVVLTNTVSNDKLKIGDIVEVRYELDPSTNQTYVNEIRIVEESLLVSIEEKIKEYNEMEEA